jgi:transcriptional regulator with XRE-family HTH domain
MKRETKHLGRNISWLRELRMMKQEILAEALGVSQQKISKIEQSEHVSDEMLEKIAHVLQVTSAQIKDFDPAIWLDKKEFHENIAHTNMNALGFDAYERIIKLYEDKVSLLQELVQEKERRIAWLEKMFNNRTFNNM